MYAGQLIGSSYMLITTIHTEDLSLHDVWDCFFGLVKVRFLLLHCFWCIGIIFDLDCILKLNCWIGFGLEKH